MACVKAEMPIELKRQIKSAKKLYELCDQAPAPSKDYFRILVTLKGVVWSRWSVTLRNTAQGRYPTPQEDVMSHGQFQEDKSLQDQLSYVLGSQCLDCVLDAILTTNDFGCLPEDLVVTLMTYLDLQSIKNLSMTNLYFSKLCNSMSLWKRLYTLYHGRINAGVQAIAGVIGWKKIFFMNKLHMQKEIARQRRKVNLLY